MRHYELMVILDPEPRRAHRRAVPGDVPQRRSATTGAPSRRSRSGASVAWPTRSPRTRRASTPSSRSPASRATVAELDRQLGLNESVLRTKVMRREPKRAVEPKRAPAPLPPRAEATAMAGETVITVVGNLTSDPELRYTQNGLRGRQLHIASTPRNFDRQPNEWKDGEALFLRCERVARIRRARRRDAHQGHPGHRYRATQAAFV